MTEGLSQITIPDLDDDDFSAPSVPFGRSAFGFSSGTDSPTLLTPTATTERTSGERDYFHSRQDSAASEDSAFSFHAPSVSFATRSNTSLQTTHSSQASLPTTAPFTKKSSFASLKNAFRTGGKSNETPPVPSFDRQAYPALRNPFNRSGSSLAHNAPNQSAKGASTGYPRPSTPSNNDHRHGRAMSTRSRDQVYGKPQHSHTGSLFHASDAGSDHSFGTHHITARQSSPPPVPRVPNEYNGLSRLEMSSTADTEDRVALDPRTPSEYALHAIFMQFAAIAEHKIERFLKEPLERDPSLFGFLGPQVDPKFDDLLLSLGQIATKSTRPVIDSIMRWRRSQQESVSSNIILIHSSSASTYARTSGSNEIVTMLNERKSLASIYIMCRALIAVVQTLPRDALGENIGFNLEETTFDQFKRPNLKALAQSRNHRINADLYATLLGKLSKHRFESVTDRFLHELGPVASNQIPKEMDMKYENLVRALKHIEIKVWPPEAFEQGAEFMESLSRCFENAHGYRLKLAFAETLVQVLHPIGKTAQAEVNHPGWAKAMEVIYSRGRDMMSKPRYWQVAYPVVITSLCVAPQDFFSKNWMLCFENSIVKLKERPFRLFALNGIMRLIWTYLYRCREATSTATNRLDGVLKHFFPASRLGVNYCDDSLEPLIYIVHFILSRHYEYGFELVLNLMQEQQVKAAQSGTGQFPFAPERTTIALEATLRSLCLLEREETAPTWPSSSDFSVLPFRDDYPSSASYCPSSILSRPGMEDFFNKVGSTLVSLVATCFKSVGKMSILDDQWSYTRTTNAYEDTSGLIIRQHPEGTIAYPTTYSSQISLLSTCFSSWPRCLHTSLPLDEALDMLIRAIIHVEPSVGEAASNALRCISEDPNHLSRVLSRFASSLFSPKQITTESSGTRLPFESPRLLNVWFTVVEAWSQSVLSRANDLAINANWLNSQFLDVETAALFLLSSRLRTARAVGVKSVRVLERIVHFIQGRLPNLLDEPLQNVFRSLDVLLGKRQQQTFLYGFDDLLDTKESNRLAQWRQASADDVLLRLASSEDERDRSLWLHIYPAIIRFQASCISKIISSCREMWVAATIRYHSSIVSLAAISSRVPPTQVGRPSGAIRERDRIISDNLPVIEQWHMWVKLTCCTAASPEPRPPGHHTRAPSDVQPERDLVSTDTRGLFRYLIPFLDSDYSVFRDIAVLCISSFPGEAFKGLLEDLGAFSARHFFVDSARVKAPPTTSVRRNRRQDRLYLAVAHIYQLTAHHLKDQRGVNRTDSLANVLKFVRHTQSFLSGPDIRKDWQQQRLRRYFCGIVEQLFDGLSSLQSSDRFIPANMHLTLYRLCEEWCQCGYQSENVKQRLVTMQTAATAGFPDPQQKAGAIAQFQTETRLLSHAACGAMAAVVQKALFPPEISSTSPTDRLSSDFLVPLEIAPTLDRIIAMLANMHDPVKVSGRKGLHSLVDHKCGDGAFLDELLRRSFVASMDTQTSNYRFFEVVAEVICKGESCQLSFGHVVCLGLANLCSPLLETRRLTLAALGAVNKKAGGKTSLTRFEASVASSAANVYLDAQYQISQHLAREHPTEAVTTVIQCASKLAMIYEVLDGYAFPHILNGLSPWFASVDLLVADNTSLTKDGRIILYHLMSLTLRYSENYPEQMFAIWRCLVSDNGRNGHATIRFLLEQSSKVGSTGFVGTGQKIVACLSRTICGRQIVEDLCEVIEPARMLPAIDHKLTFPDAEETELWADLDALFAEQPRHSLGSGQFALLFLGDVALSRAWEMKKTLPNILQGVFSHIGHRNPFVREQARKLLFQTLRSWLPGHAELTQQSAAFTQSTLTTLELNSAALFWTEDDPVSLISEKMRNLCALVLRHLDCLHADLANEWGCLALLWGTTCSIRPIAFRSLQVFRSLMPKVTQADLAQLLGRLSNTIAAQESNLHPFTVELILTLTSVAQSDNLETALLPQLYWCTVACLSTPVEAEFIQLLELLECLLDRLDLKDPYTTQVLEANKPEDFVGAQDLQPLLLTGLRSKRTYSHALRILKRLSEIPDSSLIDSSGNRVRDLYTFILPWCLHSMEDNVNDDVVVALAGSIAKFAEEENRPSIARIMTSFAKSRFRTKDDFMRQSAAALREHYARDQWTNVVSLLIGLVLNSERWLQMKSMQILKVLFQLRETRAPVDRLGSELLMPLLRLLQTDLAPQALEVLDEPISISGGLAARQVLRMSMHLGAIGQQEAGIDTEVFGIPEESGWSVARSERHRGTCRRNVMAVFDTCKMPTRPSQIEFEPEVDRFTDPLEADLGDLVQNLHELSTFFLGGTDVVTDDPSSPPPLPISTGMQSTGTLPNQQLEARVAAILAKSTDSATALDSPQTPFVDVFHVNPSDIKTNGLRHGYDGSDDDSDSSEFDADTFAFDSFPSNTSGDGHSFTNGYLSLNHRR